MRGATFILEVEYWKEATIVPVYLYSFLLLSLNARLDCLIEERASFDF